jgi:putative tryptophan/tyrosine transport system substrate-binding protein
MRSMGLAVVFILSVILIGPLGVEALQGQKIPRIGLLSPWGSPSAPPSHIEAFRTRLRELGYVEGQNIAFDYRWAEGKLDRLPALAAELSQRNVDVILTWGEAATRSAKQVTSTIPIVVGITADLVATGHAASLARPGGNITGLVDTSPELSAKRLELLKEAVPNIYRIAVLWNGANPAKVLDFTETQVAARALRITLLSLEVQPPTPDFENIFRVATQARAGGLVLLQDALLSGNAKRIMELAVKNRMPTISGIREFVDAGGLMTYGASLTDNFQRAATYVDKILKGARPADLPIEQPTKFELVINLKTAKALGLTIPQTLLLRADQVIE